MIRGIDYRIGDKTYEDLVEFSNYYQTYINQVFGDETVREEVQKILKPRSQWEIAEAIPADDNAFESGDDSMHHILRKKAKKDVIWCSDAINYQNTDINKNDTLCQSYTLLKLSGKLDNYKALPENEENHIAIQKEMIKLYRRIINDKKFTKFIDKVLGYTEEYSVAPWIDFTEPNNPHLKELKGKEMIEKIKTTLDMWEKYGHLYLVGDPIERYFIVPLKIAIQEKNLSKIKDFIDMGVRLNIVEEEDDDDIRKLFDVGTALLDDKENKPPRKKQRTRKGGKSKTKRKKAKGQTRTKKRYKSYEN
tara:strand:+ start:16 stop:933 length:918 start_codon:yes stop_codon:yes gene_type:complete